ncbi:MAG: CFI-box-CTERM domain-containing protein [Nitrosopumilus sp.]
MLREIRDNQLMNTESGSAFMSTFNEAYYSFSPYIADLERESPVFKEIVKAGLTPMLSTLAIMESAETESEVLGLGLSVIALNLGMYIGLPIIGVIAIVKRK